MVIKNNVFFAPILPHIHLERRLLRMRWAIIEAIFKDLVSQYY